MYKTSQKEAHFVRYFIHVTLRFCKRWLGNVTL